jgi:hypothetical protein
MRQSVCKGGTCAGARGINGGSTECHVGGHLAGHQHEWNRHGGAQCTAYCTIVTGFYYADFKFHLEWYVVKRSSDGWALPPRPHQIEPPLHETGRSGNMHVCWPLLGRRIM